MSRKLKELERRLMARIKKTEERVMSEEEIDRDIEATEAEAKILLERVQRDKAEQERNKI